MDEHKSAAEDSSTPTPVPRSTGRRRWLVGGLVGVMLFAVLLGGTAFAQSNAEGNSLRQTFIDRLASKLGITSDDLETAIDETRNELIDEAVANGQITEERAEALRERSFLGGGMMGRGMGGFGLRAARHLDIDLASIAAEIGITTDELKAEFQAGSTLSEIIEAHGSTVDAVVAALVTDAEAELKEAVANGNLTQEQADRILTNLPERLTQMLERDFAGDCDRWFNSEPDGTTTPDTTDDAEQTSSQV